MSDLDKLEQKLRQIPGMAEELDRAQAELTTMTYKVVVGPFSELGTALELIKIAWGSGVQASIAKTSLTATVTVGPIKEIGPAVQLVKLVSSSLPRVKFQVLGIAGDDPRKVEVITDGPFDFVADKSS